MKKNCIAVLFFSLGLITSFSCSISKQVKIQNSLKDYAYCRCLEFNTKEFSVLDKNDISSYSSLLSVEQYGIYHDFRRPLYIKLDSAAKSVLILEKTFKNDTVGRHFDVVGKTTYNLSCLYFRQSKQLDSLVKSWLPMIKKQMNEMRDSSW